MSAIPDIHLNKIFTFSDCRTLASCAPVCKNWKNVILNPKVPSSSLTLLKTAYLWNSFQTLKIKALGATFISKPCTYLDGRIAFNYDRHVLVVDLNKILSQKKSEELSLKQLPLLSSNPVRDDTVCGDIQLGEGFTLVASTDSIEFRTAESVAIQQGHKAILFSRPKFAFDRERALIVLPDSQTRNLVVRHPLADPITIPLHINILNCMEDYVSTSIEGDRVFICVNRRLGSNIAGLVGVFSIEQQQYIKEIQLINKPYRMKTCGDRMLLIEDHAHFSLYDLESYEVMIASEPLEGPEGTQISSEAMDEHRIVLATNNGDIFVYKNAGWFSKKFSVSPKEISKMVLSGNSLAVVCKDSVVKLFDLTSGDCFFSLSTKQEIHSLHFEEGKILIVRDKTGEITIVRPIPNIQEEKE